MNDSAALEAELRRTVDGAVRFDDRRAGHVVGRRVELPPRPDRRRRPARRRGRRGGRVRVPGARRAGAPGRRADLDRGPGRQHRRRPRLPAPEPDPGGRPGRPHRPRRARRDLRRAARRRRAARADVRPRPVDAQPLHARRDDRQQRVRVALGGVGQDRRQRRRPGRAHLPRRAAVTGGGRGRRHPRQISIRQPCARWASGPPTTSAPASPTSPAASRATTWTSCCPGGSTWPRRWSGPRARARC